MPEAQNWTDVNSRPQLSVWDRSGPKFEGSGPMFDIKSKHDIQRTAKLYKETSHCRKHVCPDTISDADAS